MSLRSATLLALILLLGSGVSPLLAGEPGPASRPRIGLVLSGGGARGAAHVGVLKVLDELRIPVDAIAGTSMGAVVGGLYASGLTGAQIEKELASVDWESAFSDRPPRADLNFRRKREDRDFLVRLPLGLRDGRFQLPRGLIQGQKLSEILRRLTLPVSQVRSFDELPIRFRAVATDLETGEGVVMDGGDLANAIRASLSAPGIFAPVERDGRLLVDGGIADNLPVRIAREMGVDVLIVVDVGFTLVGRDRLDSVAGVSNQMLAILIRRESDRERATLGPQDILIDPALRNLSSFDFSRLTRAMDIGEQAAREAVPRLARLSLGEADYAAWLAQRRMPVLPETQVAFVRVDAASREFAAPVNTLFGSLAGKPLQLEELESRVSRYYGQGVLETLDYRLEPQSPADPDSPLGLTFSARANSWGPNYVRFGLRLQDDFTGNSTFDAAVRVKLTELNRAGAEWVWDAQVGGTPRIATELFLPFSQRQRWFAAPSAVFQIHSVAQVDPDTEEQVGELRVRSTRYGIDVGRQIGNAAELRAGMGRELGSSWVRLGDTTEPRDRFRTRESFLRYSLDRFDSVAFPRRGDSLLLEWRGQLDGRFENKVSDSLRFDWRLARSWGRNTGLVWVSGGSLLDPQFADARSFFTLGGFLNLSGLTADTLSGPHYAITRLIYYRQVGRGGEGFLNVPMYAGMSFEAGNAWQNRGDMEVGSARKDFSVFFGLDTFLGPAYFAVGYDARGRSAFYLSLGRGF
ncbi:MAG: patatin-like phospholipase family protein [Steroidobacteraceae bacterium]